MIPLTHPEKNVTLSIAEDSRCPFGLKLPADVENKVETSAEAFADAG